MYSLYLAHHGRQGQRWGVRHGPPYPLRPGAFNSQAVSVKKKVKKRKTIPEYSKAQQKQIYKTFSKISKEDKERKKTSERAIAEAGIKHKISSDVLKKGATFIRYSDKMNESIDNYRKYGSIVEEDISWYKEDAIDGHLSAKGKDVYMYQFKTANKMQIARGKAICDAVIKQYGDKRINDAYKAYLKVPERDRYKALETYDENDKTKWMVDAVYDNRKALIDFMHKTMYDEKISKDIYSKYKKKGYNAIVDPEDYLYGYHYPLIVLDPGSSLVKPIIKKIQ